jgi:hypothetical protein
MPAAPLPAASEQSGQRSNRRPGHAKPLRTAPAAAPEPPKQPPAAAPARTVRPIEIEKDNPYGQ